MDGEGEGREIRVGLRLRDQVGEDDEIYGRGQRGE